VTPPNADLMRTYVDDSIQSLDDIEKDLLQLVATVSAFLTVGTWKRWGVVLV
jgi:hypothetical protein